MADAMYSDRSGCAADPDQLLALWSHDEVRIVARRPEDLEDYPDLPLRMRGALGEALASLPETGRRASPRSAFQDLFGGDPGGGARPMAVDVDVASGLVTIDLRLFGAARVHVDAVRAAMIAALDGGVSLRPRGRRVMFEPVDCLVRRTAPPWPAPITREAVVRFVTPLVIRSGRRLSAANGAFLSAMVERVNGLARWSGIEPTFAGAVVREAARSVAISSIEMQPVSMQRWSRRMPGQPIPVTGVLGKIRLTGSLQPFVPYLLIARATHVGSHSALGFGRVEVSCY